MVRGRTVVVTGMGVVSPIGVGIAAFREALLAGRSGVGTLSGFDASHLPVRLAAEVRDFDAKAYVQPRKNIKLMARDIQMGVAAGLLACRESGLEAGRFDPTRFGVTFGSDLVQDALGEVAPLYQACLKRLPVEVAAGAEADSAGEAPHAERKFDFSRWGGEAPNQVFPLFMLKYLPNMAACQTAIAVDARGPSNSIVQGAPSSLLAIQEAARAIERGTADVMLAGGTGTRITPLCYIQSILGRQLSRRNDDPAAAARPFDADRDGMVLGEGAAALILESEEHARNRGAVPLARFCGAQSACVARRSPSYTPGKSLRLALERTLREANWSPADVGHVNVDASGAVAADQVAAEVIVDVLGKDVPVTAPQSRFGLLGAGGGATELIAGLIGMRDGRVPRTLNHDRPSPDCPVNVVRGADLVGPASRRVVKLCRSAEGQAIALAFERWDD